MATTGNIIRREESTIPNHVKNVLKFSKLKPKDKEFILTKFTTEIEGEEVFPLNRLFDFDKVIPEPRSEGECPDDCKMNKDSHVVSDKDRPWFDWYAWHNKYWGTKWNCYDGYIIVGTSTITFVFSTAWNTPQPIYEQIAKHFCYNFNVRYADEDMGNNCGEFIYNPEKTGFDSLIHHTEHDLTNPYNFARRLWSNY